MNWSKDRAWEWYNGLPWLRGCNFIGSDCANRRDMWQSFHAKEHLETADRELALAEQTGFNTIRVILDFDVYYQEPESFMDVLEKYIEISASHHQYVMIVLTAEAELPHGKFEDFVPKPLGEQVYALGYHQGRSPEVLALYDDTSNVYHPMESPILRDKFLEMVRRVVTRYKDDERVVCWNVYNEPGIVIHDRAIPIVREMFEIIREVNPIQPLTAELWAGFYEDGSINEVERISLELSDVISFHCYFRFGEFCKYIDYLKQYGRPLLCTEWLNRIRNCSIYDIFPLLHAERIGCWCWGFVVGKTQTNEPYYFMCEEYEKGNLPDIDFTKWMHDLYRQNGFPYDPREIEIIRRYSKM